MDSKKPIYKSISFWIIVLFFLYSALGFLAVPYYIKKQITQIAATEFNSKLTFDSLSFNPYSFSINIKNIQLTDNDSQVWFSADKILINIGLIKTLIGHTKISEISLNNPYYYLLLEKQNNNLQIKYPKLNVSETEQDTTIGLDIDLININKGSLLYQDESTDKSVNLTFNTIDFEHINFTTEDSNSHFDLSLITEKNDQTEISGQFNFAQLKSTGKWKLNQFSTETTYKFISDENQQFYGFANKNGEITANGEYVFDLNNQGLTDISINSLTLSNFMTQTSNDNQPRINIKQLKLYDSQIDLIQKKILISSIETQDLEIAAYFLENNSLQWQYLDQQTNQSELTNQSKHIWQYQIDTIKNENSSIELNKFSANEYHQNTLLFNTSEITNFSNDKKQKVELTFSITPDNEGVLILKATINQNPLIIDSQFNAKEINLVSSQAWLPNDIRMKIKQGTMSSIQNFNWSNDQYTSIGWLNITNLDLLDEDNQSILKVSELKLTDSHVDSATKAITLNNIVLNKAQGDLSVSANSQLNINSLVAELEDGSTINDKIHNPNDEWIINIKQVDLIDLQSPIIDYTVKPNDLSTLSKNNESSK